MSLISDHEVRCEKLRTRNNQGSDFDASVQSVNCTTCLEDEKDFWGARKFNKTVRAY